MSKTRLNGDREATISKAISLMKIAHEEVDALKGDVLPHDRARLRQASNKAWMALSTGADAYLCATEGRPVQNKSDVLRVYKGLGSKTAGEVNLVYTGLHIGCGYNDDPACTRDTSRAGFRLAGQALHTLRKRLLAAQRRGKAGKSCPAWPARG